MITSSNEPNTGYKKPPKSTQFKKGKSGNPKGRPPQKRSPESEFKKWLFTKVSIKQSDRIRKMTRIEIIIRSLQKKATEGNVRAYKVHNKWKNLIPTESIPDYIPSINEEYGGRFSITYSQYYNYLSKYGFSDPEFEEKYAKDLAEVEEAKAALNLS